MYDRDNRLRQALRVSSVSIITATRPFLSQRTGLIFFQALFYCDREHCEIVKLRRISDKLIDRAADISEELFGARERFFVKRFEHSFRTEKRQFPVCGFGNAVGIYKQRRSLPNFFFSYFFSLFCFIFGYPEQYQYCSVSCNHSVPHHVHQNVHQKQGDL